MSLPEIRYPVVCFGEIAWNVVSEEIISGGSAMNVAYHLKQLGINPAFITRVGADKEGKKLIQLMEKAGITTDFFQVDFELNTGSFHRHRAEDNQFIYDIAKPVAWDNIQWDDAFLSLLPNASYFVFSSLVTRGAQSRHILYRLLELATNKVLDINLRSPYYNRQIIEKLLHNIYLLKLNLAELELITGWFSHYNHERDRIKVLQDKFCISNIVVTRGRNGSILSTGSSFYEHPGFPAERYGTSSFSDAFLAGLLLKLLQNARPDEALEYANAAGTVVAGFMEVCPVYKPEKIDELMHSKAL